MTSRGEKQDELAVLKKGTINWHSVNKKYGLF